MISEMPTQDAQDVSLLLSNLQPCLVEGAFVFCTSSAPLSKDLDSIATFTETEGLSFVVSQAAADREGLHYNGVFALISLKVQSSLHAVGLTAALSTALADAEISANVVAAFHHDHLFVPAERALEALAILQNLSQLGQG